MLHAEVLVLDRQSAAMRQHRNSAHHKQNSSTGVAKTHHNQNTCIQKKPASKREDAKLAQVKEKRMTVQAPRDADQYDPPSRKMVEEEPRTAPAASHTAVLLRHTPPGHPDLTSDGFSIHSMTARDDKSVSHGQSHDEPSEEELLQWQPVFPAKKTQAAADSVRTAMSKPDGIGTFPTKKALTAAVKSPMTSLHAAAAGGALGKTGRPVLTANVSVTSRHSTASASLSAPAARPSLTSSALSSLPHALHAEPLWPQSSLPLLPCSSSLSCDAAAAAAAVPAPSLSDSVDSDWRAPDLQTHRHSISSWSSGASDAHLLRHSTASTATRSLTAGAADAVIPPEYTVTVVADEASDSPLAPVDWKLLDTAELHSQTAALLSSLTTSLDWDLSTADAQLHRQLGAADLPGTGLASAAVPASDLTSMTSLSEFHTLPGANSMEAVAAADRVRQGQGQAARAAGWRSHSSSASSGLLSSHSRRSGICLHAGCAVKKAACV